MTAWVISFPLSSITRVSARHEMVLGKETARQNFGRKGFFWYRCWVWWLASYVLFLFRKGIHFLWERSAAGKIFPKPAVFAQLSLTSRRGFPVSWDKVKLKVYPRPWTLANSCFPSSFTSHNPARKNHLQFPQLSILPLALAFAMLLLLRGRPFFPHSIPHWSFLLQLRRHLC